MKLLLIASLFILASCGSQTTTVTKYYEGKDGTSCNVTRFDTGLEVVCTDGTSAFVYDGEDGDDFNFEVLDPCGPSGKGYDEVLLRFDNGLIISSFSDNAEGKNTRFSILTVGTFITTDNSKCVFSVDDLGNIYDEHY